LPLYRNAATLFSPSQSLQWYSARVLRPIRFQVSLAHSPIHVNYSKLVFGHSFGIHCACGILHFSTYFVFQILVVFFSHCNCGLLRCLGEPQGVQSHLLSRTFLTYSETFLVVRVIKVLNAFSPYLRPHSLDSCFHVA